MERRALFTPAIIRLAEKTRVKSTLIAMKSPAMTRSLVLICIKITSFFKIHRKRLQTKEGRKSRKASLKIAAQRTRYYTADAYVFRLKATSHPLKLNA
jgi:hypothetical protein